MPVPEGPDRTMGRSFDEEGWVVGAMVENVVRLEIEDKGVRGRGCEFGNEVIETVWCDVKVTLRLADDLKLGCPPRFGLCRIVKVLNPRLR